METLSELRQQPLIINNNDLFYDILESSALNSARARKSAFNRYEYNGVPVARVTSIIDDTFNKDFLIKWACSFGSFGRYLGEKDFATDVGTAVHDRIEHYLKTGEDIPIQWKKAPKQAPCIKQAYDNFKAWYKTLINNGNSFEILGIEVPLVNYMYGGTADCICRINNANYIIDFKTSKKISYDYILQAAAYMWTVNNGFAPEFPHIDGIGIIRVDKYAAQFEDLFFNSFIPYQNDIINQAISCFGSIVNTYYQKLNIEYQVNKYKKNYTSIIDVLKEIEGYA